MATQSPKAPPDEPSARLDLRAGSKVYGRGVTTYRISQLVELCGVPATTLRFYESAGLLPAERTPAGYRIYDDSAVDRLTFITSAKHLGLSLDEIPDLLNARDKDVCATVRERLLRLVEARIADTDRRIAELSAFNAHLTEAHLDLSRPAPAGACGPNCGCVTAAPSGPVPVALNRSRPDQDSEPRPRPGPLRSTPWSTHVTEPRHRPKPWTTVATGAAAIGACAVCCAGPILTFFGGLSIVSLAGAIWIPAVAIVAVAALAGAVWILRRRKASSCRTAFTDNSAPVDVGMPAPAAHTNSRADTAGPRQ